MKSFMYFIRTPAWLPRLYVRDGMWTGPAAAKPTVYLTFDDGPHPEVTHFVLEQLDRFEATGTFFCIGQNAVAHPGLTERLQRSRHRLGNHTHRHLNGKNTRSGVYLADVEEAARVVPSALFRPPYGRIRAAQVQGLVQRGFQVCMWSLLSADFDADVSPQQCLQNVVFHVKPGDIVVFHDSEKAWPRLEYALPRVLELCRRQGWEVEGLGNREQGLGNRE